MSRIRRDVRWGARWGVFGGTVYAVISGLIVVARGRPAFGPTQIPLITLLAVYILGGLTAGVIVGLLRPFTERRLGATVVGGIAGVPVLVAAFLAFKGPPSTWGITGPIFVPISGFLVGSLFGYKSWELRGFTTDVTGAGADRDLPYRGRPKERSGSRKPKRRG